MRQLMVIMNFKMLSLIVLSLFVFYCFSSSAYAQTKQPPNPNPNTNAGKGGVNTINLGQSLAGSNLGIQADDKPGLLGTILQNVLLIFFAIGGIGTVIYFIWGAVDWILAGGDKEKVSNARKKMTQAIIGLVLLALSFVIIRIVGQIVGFNPLEKVEIRKLDEL